MFGRVAVIGCLAVVRLCAAQNSSSYAVSVDGIFVTDVATGVSDIVAIHNDRPFNVVANLVWESDFYDVASSNQISWQMFVNDVVEATGVLDLVEVRSLTVPIILPYWRAIRAPHHTFYYYCYYAQLIICSLYSIILFQLHWMPVRLPSQAQELITSRLRLSWTPFQVKVIAITRVLLLKRASGHSQSSYCSLLQLVW
jgi:hypothetical protein